MHDIETEKDIKMLVQVFYARIEEDERLGFIFNEVAAVNWDEHLKKMVSFWSKLLFGTSRYQGRPFRQHMPLPIKRDDFSHWVSLFVKTVDKHFEGKRANYAKVMAENIANSFSTRMAMSGKFKESKKKKNEGKR